MDTQNAKTPRNRRTNIHLQVENDKTYKARQKSKRGLVQITIWVPADQAELFKESAAEAREDHLRALQSQEN